MGRKEATTQPTKTSSPAGAKHYSVLLNPFITEKTAGMGSSKQGVEKKTVVFRVKTDATKIAIREAVEKIFNVKVDGVRTINLMGKPKRTTGTIGRRIAVKKAYVTLKPGQSIEVVEGL